MDTENVLRKVQCQKGSYIVTIPAKMAHTLGIQKDQYVMFAITNGKLIIKPASFKISKKDLTEADKNSGHLEDKEVPSYVAELSAALKRDGSQSRLEKLRMK